MDKLVWLNTEEREEAEKLFGITHGNFPPANMKEVNEEVIAKGYNFGARFQWFQQVYLDYDETISRNQQPLTGIHCFGFYDGSGFAVHCDYWGKKLRWFTFAGCIHEYRTPTKEEYAAHHDWPGNCYHISICDKCNYWKTIDSSD